MQMHKARPANASHTVIEDVGAEADIVFHPVGVYPDTGKRLDRAASSANDGALLAPLRLVVVSPHRQSAFL
jgi:hypothetical protein